MTISLSMTPAQAAKVALQTLPAKRMREVLERRFGLKGEERHTLEDIGKGYRITRERVRQIEADALRRLRAETADMSRDFLRPVADEMEKRGLVMAEAHLFAHTAQSRFHPHLRLLLTAAPGFHFFPETDAYHNRWALNPAAAGKAEDMLARLTGRLGEIGRPVTQDALYAMLAEGVQSANGVLDPAAAEACLRMSKCVLQNPYGEYGLAEWPTISPRGIRDKAYGVLAKTQKPMHFRDVASAIDRAGWLGAKSKKAHPQTVHNELIKDGRFVLVGRGLYGLRERGYEPGTVRDVMVSLFKSQNRPLARDEVVQMAVEKRMVKPQTILLNLQDRGVFRRGEDGKYTLV